MDSLPGLIKVNFSVTPYQVSVFLGETFTGVIEDIDGDVFYYVNGRKHRVDGPAVIWAPHRPGSRHWWCLHDSIYGFDTWCELTLKTPAEKLLLQIAYGV